MGTLILVYAALFLIRAALALRHAGRFSAAADAHPAAAILQPILSGDPGLESFLRRNAEGLGGTERLYWLVDDDDPAGQAAARAAGAGGNVRILSGPGPRDGENPKVAKLDRALAAVGEEITVVLDDDTVLAPGAMARLKTALGGAALVTGLPVFVSKGSLYERFIGGFVNGNAVLTYLPAAACGAQHTINGMIYAARTGQLRSVGGFAAIRHALTDDYAIAQLFEKAGLPVAQTPVAVEVGMTIGSAAHCGRVLRRWFVFANRYLRENRNPATLLLVALPSLLPLGGVAAGMGWPWIGCLAAKAVGNRLLLYRITGHGSTPADILFEVFADLLSPLFYLSALVRPARIQWRSRHIEMDGERIHYR